MNKISLRIIALTLTLLFSNQYLSTWGLLQGRETAIKSQETKTYIQGLYQVYNPFYAGPLLAPSASTVPKGKVNLQPYFYWTRTYGTYNHSWHKVRTRSALQFTFQSIQQVGITDFMDFTTVVQANYNRKQNQHYFSYGDTGAKFGFQLLREIMEKPVPNCKFTVGMIFPTGRYQHLGSNHLGLDSNGAGTYSTQFSLNFQKDFNHFLIFKKDLDPKHFHPVSLRWSFTYLISPKTKVSGINTYGGGPGTKGTVKPGNNFNSIFAWEYSFNQHWVFATDWLYTITPRSKFFGNSAGAQVGVPSNQNFSVAPAIEYNLNGNFGVLAGAWFSLTGRNSSAFVTGIFTFSWLF